MEDIASVAVPDGPAPSDGKTKKRKAGDPLECECPVCARVKAVIKDAGMLDDVSDGVGVVVIKDSMGRPEDGALLRGPNLNQPFCFTSPETLNVGSGTTDDAKQDMAEPKGRCLRIVRRSAWAGDGR